MQNSQKVKNENVLGELYHVLGLLTDDDATYSYIQPLYKAHSYNKKNIQTLTVFLGSCSFSCQTVNKE